jgi:diguanylate cyclase (GGDEF)-like protein/PAS domain S-box-containing protein
MKSTARMVMRLRKKRSRLERLTLLPILAALVGVWILTLVLTLSERRFTLERVESQLTTAIATLADFNELAEQATGDAIVRSADHRTAAIWRALLQYPTASIWVESDGVISGGQEPLETTADAIVVQDSRENFTVHAALPRADALTDWQRSAWQRGIVLLLASVVFIILSMFLVRALKHRTVAEQEAVKQRERATELARYKEQLEATVAVRTGELKESNDLLGKELIERKAAEAQLKEHDALLHAVTKSASELLSTRSLDEATATVLALIGQTLAVSRVHINTIVAGRDGHLKSSVRHEWCAPNLARVVGKAVLHELDLAQVLPHLVGPLLGGRLTSFSVGELSGELRDLFEQSEMRSCLQIPIVVDDKLWGSISFIDSAEATRQWSWAETDTLQTLAGLFGVAIARERYVKELADANMIVQNSPTILYRLKGEPPFPMIYVSHNIKKFGHDAAEMLEKSNWAQALMDPEDEAKVDAAMARTVEKDAEGASIEFRLRMADGRYRWVENRYTTVRDRNGRLLEIEGMIIDITERKAAEDKISLLARTDSLTDLANRGTFIERLRLSFAATKRGGNPFAILYLDLDHFKTINDTLGHQTGDALLREVAQRLKACARDTDVVARLGGDEFAILQTEISEPANAGTLAATIQAALTRPYLLDGNDVQITVSIGICPYVADSAGPDAMLAQADLALYRSKDEGRNRYRFHTDDLDDLVLERMTLADELRSAMAKDELELYYQPQVELATGRIVGMEALVRWHHPTRGLLPAQVFVPVAEKTGAIVALGQWVLERACAQWRLWRDSGMEPGVLTVNVSFAQLKNGRELMNDVKAALERQAMVPSDLSFDVTEATLAKATLMHSGVLADLRALGVQIAIADFGSEYSSLNYLRTYRVSHLKIAQAFIDASVNDAERAKTMRAISNLAHELGIGVISQNVETAEQHELSRATSTIAQGQYFAEAMDVGEVTGLLRVGMIEPLAGSGTSNPRERRDAPAAEPATENLPRAVTKR